MSPDSLEYKSKTPGKAHMCGHDGHCAWQLGCASKFMEIIDTIPSDKTLRLLFQPAEEGPGGAYPMIQEGALAGINEIYGAHNLPTQKVGKCLVKAGPVMASGILVEIRFFGKGGHGSAPENCKDPLQAAIDFHVEYRKLVEELKSTGKWEVLKTTLPTIKAGETHNVIQDRALIRGSLRSLDDKILLEFKVKVAKTLKEVCVKADIKYDLYFGYGYPPTISTEKEANHVLKVAKQVYGEENVSDEGLPLMASEDYGYFTKYVPGAFFFISSGKKEADNAYLHEPTYDFEDQVIEKASEMFFELAKYRLSAGPDELQRK